MSRSYVKEGGEDNAEKKYSFNLLCIQGRPDWRELIEEASLLSLLDYPSSVLFLYLFSCNYSTHSTVLGRGSRENPM